MENLPYLEGLDRPWMPANFSVIGKDGMPMMPEPPEVEPAPMCPEAEPPTPALAAPLA